MTKKQITNILYVCAFIAISTYLAYVKGWILSDFESISPKQAYALLQNDSNVALLDVRTPDEFLSEHIEGALLIPVQDLSQNLSQLETLKEKKIIVYCHSGNRSVAASRILLSNGYTPLNLTGGIMQWKSEGLSTQR